MNNICIEKKVVAKDSCNLAVNQGSSHETNIKVTSEIASLFVPQIEDADSFDVKFEIYKNDFLLCLKQIMLCDIHLYKSSDGSSIYKDDTFYQTLITKIENYFGEAESKEIDAKLGKPAKHPICLNFGSSRNKICIRDFLVENHSVLFFSKYKGKVRLNIRFDNGHDYDINEEDSDFQEIDIISDNNTLQQIYYGAPGTGKSYEVKKQTGEIDKDGKESFSLPNVFRTTFHPDSDYSTFVGCYKPTMKNTGETRTINGGEEEIEEISYEFVPQVFTNAYIYAYNHPEENTYLVLEEINRGNCAQIFGDLFQLLDRKNGVSEYSIKADLDLAAYLKKELNEEGQKGVTDGKLCLPSNLHILATMNTSDQSLFPIDSAFKRRWDWKYIPITKGDKEHYVSVKKKLFSWWDFMEFVNQKIDDVTSSEDKQIGYWFAKPDDDDIISANAFVGKVIFYLWNDVFKDYMHSPNNLFNVKSKKEEGNASHLYKFREFFKADGSADEVVLDKFLTAIGLVDKNVLNADDAEAEVEENAE